MKHLKGMLLPIIASTVWVSICEFARNELLFKQYWVDHYKGMGLAFPSETVNGALWGLWALVFSAATWLASRKLGLLQTFALSWVYGFVLMWLVIGNLGVLPFELLYFAVPWSMLEALVAALILKKGGWGK